MQPLNTELILIRITGEDRPGLTASVTEILAKYDATILDIGQADIHNTLSLGILCKTEEQLGVHYEGTAFQGFLPGRDCPFLPHYYQRVRGLGEYAGKEPLYSYFIGA